MDKQQTPTGIVHARVAAGVTSDTRNKWLKPGEVAALFRVDPKTVSRWVAKGKFKTVMKTPGGHWRISREEVVLLLNTEEIDEVA